MFVHTYYTYVVFFRFQYFRFKIRLPSIVQRLNFFLSSIFIVLLIFIYNENERKLYHLSNFYIHIIYIFSSLYCELYFYTKNKENQIIRDHK